MENKTSKYFKYAIGEIFLVMVGILLALQVNNWNENRKLNQVELTVIKELKNDLIFSHGELDTINMYNQRYLNDYKLIKTYIDENRPQDLTLNKAFDVLDIWEEPYLPTMAYESLKAKGIDLIKNDSLKRHIVTVYDFNIHGQVENMNEWEWSFNQNTTQKYMVGNIRRDINENLARPNDFEKLKKDDEFVNFLHILILMRESTMDINNRAKKAISGLIEHLENEIESRK